MRSLNLAIFAAVLSLLFVGILPAAAQMKQTVTVLTATSEPILPSATKIKFAHRLQTNAFAAYLEASQERAADLAKLVTTTTAATEPEKKMLDWTDHVVRLKAASEAGLSTKLVDAIAAAEIELAKAQKVAQPLIDEREAAKAIFAIADGKLNATFSVYDKARDNLANMLHQPMADMAERLAKLEAAVNKLETRESAVDLWCKDNPSASICRARTAQ